MTSTMRFDKWENTLGQPYNAVLQVVTGSTETPVTNTTATFVNTGLTATITPKLINSTILVFVAQNGVYKSLAHPDNGIRLRLMRGANVEAVSLIGYTANSQEGYHSWSLMWTHTPNSLSPVTFSTQFRNEITASGGSVVQQGGAHSRITLMEIAQ
jgi:hypothetical protein